MTCPGSKRIIGGGFGFTDNIGVQQNHPFNNNAWFVSGSRPLIPLPGVADATLTGYAICATTN